MAVIKKFILVVLIPIAYLIDALFIIPMIVYFIIKGQVFAPPISTKLLKLLFD